MMFVQLFSKSKNFLWIVLLMSVFYAPVDTCFAMNINKFDEAVIFYNKENYEKSIELFQELLKENTENPYLNYNLGTAYFQNHELGLAKLYLEKSFQMIPRNSNVKRNFKLVNENIPIQNKKSLSVYLNQTIYIWHNFLTNFEYKSVILTFLILNISLYFWLIFRKRRILSIRFFMNLILSIYIIFSIWIYEEVMAGQYAIIIESNTPVQATFLESDKALFFLYEGAKIKILDEQFFSNDKTWYKISLPQGQSGWVKGTSVGMI